MSDTQHAAASMTDARLAAWIPAPGSADADLLSELPTITARTRDLARNSGIAAGYIQTAKDNIVGHQLRLSSTPDYRLLGKDKAWAREWGTGVEAEFRTWADTCECDAGASLTFVGMTHQILAGALLNGDAVAIPLWIPRAGSRWNTRMQIIEADRLSTPTWKSADPNLRAGVEIDAYGAPTAYWLQKQHPGDRYGYALLQAAQWERIPAFTSWGRRRVVHLHDKERTGQSRGKSIFTAVLREFKVSSEYLGHEVQAAAANSVIAAFLESDLDPASISELFGNDPDGAHWKAVSEKYNRKKLEGGLIMNLPVGTRMSSFSPSRPNVAFPAFMNSIARHLATGLNIPYELLMKDFSQTNYSSARAALLEAWRYFLGRRRWIADYWLRPVFELWLEEAIESGRVEAPDYHANSYAYGRARWIFAGRGWVDPVREVQAAQIRMETGISTLEAECAEQGQDWEEVLEQRALETARMRELGLPVPQAPGAAQTDTEREDPTDDSQPGRKESGEITVQ